MRVSLEEFGVHGATIHSDAIEVIGRCFKGPITVGTTFTRVSRGDQEGKVVHLQVLNIEAYGHDLSQLDEGMTGRLILGGEFPVDLQDGSVLQAV